MESVPPINRFLEWPCPPRRAQADFEETEKKDAKFSKDELKECAAAVSGDHDPKHVQHKIIQFNFWTILY